MSALDFSVRTDVQWISQLKQDDAQAVDDLWQMLYVFAWNVAAKQGYSADLAHDAAVAAFERLRKRGIAQYAFKCPFPGYCHRIVVNECYRRAGKKRVTTVGVSAELRGDDDITLPTASDEKVRARMHSCLEQLPAREHTIITQLYTEGLAPEDVASRHSIERNHVNQLAYRARKKLRLCLEALGFHSAADLLAA